MQSSNIKVAQVFEEVKEYLKEPEIKLSIDEYLRIENEYIAIMPGIQNMLRRSDERYKMTSIISAIQQKICGGLGMLNQHYYRYVNESAKKIDPVNGEYIPVLFEALAQFTSNANAETFIAILPLLTSEENNQYTLASVQKMLLDTLLNDAKAASFKSFVELKKQFDTLSIEYSTSDQEQLKTYRSQFKTCETKALENAAITLIKETFINQTFINHNPKSILRKLNTIFAHREVNPINEAAIEMMGITAGNLKTFAHTASMLECFIAKIIKILGFKTQLTERVKFTEFLKQLTNDPINIIGMGVK